MCTWNIVYFAVYYFCCWYCSCHFFSRLKFQSLWQCVCEHTIFTISHFWIVCHTTARIFYLNYFFLAVFRMRLHYYLNYSLVRTTLFSFDHIVDNLFIACASVLFFICLTSVSYSILTIAQQNYVIIFFYCHCKTVRAFWKVVECRFSILYNAPLVGFLLPNKNLLTNQWRNSKHTHRIACMRSPHLYTHSYKSVLWLTATKIALNTPSNSSAYNAIKSFYPQRFMFSWTIFALGRCRLLILGH